nr:MAG: hypothetical protein [Microviridae sp.]
MGAYKQRPLTTSQMKINDSYIGETLEQKIARATSGKEPITDTADKPIYTERKDGVLPAYNIRTDKMEVALEAMDYVSKSKIAARADRQKARESIIKDIEGGKPQGGVNTSDQPING